MANIHFYLRKIKTNRKGQNPIVMRVTHNYARPIFFIGYSIHPKYWSKVNEKVLKERDGEAENNYQAINERIILFRQKAETAINQALKNDLPITETYLKNEILSIGDQGKTSGKLNFFEVFDNYISLSKSVRAGRTITGYGTVKNFLMDFQVATGHRIEINAIDLGFFDQLISYAFNTRKIKDNYFAKIIRVLKAMLNWAAKRGYVRNQLFHDFKASEKEIDVVYLTLDELTSLYNKEFEKAYLNHARDVFCFMCFTGLRVSDVQNLKNENIQQGQIIKTIVKTRTTEIIPLNRFAQNILDRYKDYELSPLPVLSSQKLNKYIKDCCKELKMFNKITFVEYSGGKAKEETKMKYELITNHTARKTFITNSIMLGMNTKTIKDITGHRKDSVFNKYIKISEDFKKLEMERTWDNIPQHFPKQKRKTR
jgi:integrase